jgi:hypothetical protein
MEEEDDDFYEPTSDPVPLTEAPDASRVGEQSAAPELKVEQKQGHDLEEGEEEEAAEGDEAEDTDDSVSARPQQHPSLCFSFSPRP